MRSTLPGVDFFVMNQAKLLSTIVVNLFSGQNSRKTVTVPITEETSGETIKAEAYAQGDPTGTEIQTDVVTGGPIGSTI